MGKLIELAERAERATGPDRELDAEIEALFGLYPEGYERAVVAGRPMPYYWNKARWREPYWTITDYTASIDAAMQLVPEGWHVGRLDEDWRTGSWEARLVVRPSEAQRKAFEACRVISNRDSAATASTAALAICASSLRARDGGEGL